MLCNHGVLDAGNNLQLYGQILQLGFSPARRSCNRQLASRLQLRLPVL